MNGVVEGMDILIEGGPSRGRKLLRLPRVFDRPVTLPCMEVTEGKPLIGSVDAELGIFVELRPNSDTSDVIAFLVGKVIADRVLLIPGRIGKVGTGSELVWFSGGGIDLRFAEAEAVIVAPLSALIMFIDIFRRKPHLPGLADVLATMRGVSRRFDWIGETFSASV